MEIKVMHQIMEWNEDVSDAVKAELAEHRVCLVNVMGSPGAGKTSMIVELINRLRDRYRIGVIEGDIAGQVDADKIHAMGIPVVQLDTDGGVPHRGHEYPAAAEGIFPAGPGCSVCRKHRQPGVPGGVQHR